MTETAQSGASGVDWANVERRGRRRQWFLIPTVPVVFGAMFLLTGRLGAWEGRAAWAALGVVVVLGVVVLSVVAATPRFRARTDQGLRTQHAMHHLVDPGPELRRRTDVQARTVAANGWFGWFFLLLPVSFLLQGRWDRPLLAVPAAIVLVTAAAAFVLFWRRQVAAARRWVANPPGPPRDGPPPRWPERWLSGRRALWLIVGLVVVNALVVLVLALVLR